MVEDCRACIVVTLRHHAACLAHKPIVKASSMPDDRSLFTGPVLGSSPLSFARLLLAVDMACQPYFSAAALFFERVCVYSSLWCVLSTMSCCVSCQWYNVPCGVRGR